jgi:hypothetical protein
VHGLAPSRALLFTDDRNYVENSARVMSEQIPTKLHAACLGDRIEIYQNGKRLETLGPFKLPFREGAYRPDPTQPANAETNAERPASDWRTFVLNEVLGKHPEVATTTLFGPVYQAGQNLQWANVVAHLDRDTWSDFNMRQREARSLRRGQTRPVTVMNFDSVFAHPKSNLDGTLDQVRELHAKNDRALLQNTLVAAQKISLGSDLKPVRPAETFDENEPGSPNDMESFAAGVEPTPARVGAAQ